MDSLGLLVTVLGIMLLGGICLLNWFEQKTSPQSAKRLHIEVSLILIGLGLLLIGTILQILGF